jgi:hypothetical protein
VDPVVQEDRQGAEEDRGASEAEVVEILIAVVEAAVLEVVEDLEATEDEVEGKYLLI